jgi:hypothetical protein
MKIAMFKNIDSDYDVIGKCDDDGLSWMDGRDDYIRLSESLDVEFTMLEPPDSEIKKRALAKAKKDAEIANELVRSLESEQ